MRVFVTGATGFVGSAVVHELLEAGHEVLGLARSDASAVTLSAQGAAVQRGSLEDLDSLRQGAATADAVIHTAFNHDFSKFAANCEQDRQAILALGGELEGSTRPLLVTSGLATAVEGRAATEDDAALPPSPAYPRASEQAADELVARGVHAAVVRLSASVHGAGDHAFVPELIRLARGNGTSLYVDDGANRWPAVHRLDAARLFRLAIEKGAAGARYHAVAEAGIPLKDIATVIGRHLDVPLTRVSADEAGQRLGWIAAFAGMDLFASAEQTRAALGWQPQKPGLLADLEAGHYFRETVVVG